MLEILVTKEFQNRYSKLPIAIQKKAEKQEKLFRQNPFYPSLHTEKLKPKGKQNWSFRVDKVYRIVFRFVSENKILFLTIGRHDWVYMITKTRF